MNDLKVLQNRKMKENFLVNKPIAKEYQLDDQYAIPFGYIYCIENVSNGMKYIGSTYSTWAGCKPTAMSQLSKRASHYIYEYNSASKTLSKSNTVAARYNRPIIQAMLEFGFENFIMYPLAETTRDTHAGAEQHFIDKFNTIANGYNLIRVTNPIDNPIHRKLMASEKKLRSTGVVCINLNDKKIIFSDSMKLFGDFLGCGKDLIKNANRNGRAHKGWFIFYIDDNKRSYILNKNVLGDGIKDQHRRHSDKSKNFYKSLYGAVTMYLRDFANEEFFPGFTVLSPLEYKDQ